MLHKAVFSFIGAYYFVQSCKGGKRATDREVKKDSVVLKINLSSGKQKMNSHRIKRSLH